MSASTPKIVTAEARPESATLEIVRAFTPADMMDVLAIRRRVFADEQHVADLRVSDPDDGRSVIALARLLTHDDHRIERWPVATGRLTPPLAYGSQALIAWVATLPEYRGQGIGSELMRFLLRAADKAGTREVALAAQAHAEAFYRRLGFSVAGPHYDVRGIPHVRMVRRGVPVR
jgi:predicted GNAT family N-acyltransferase